jgi:ribosomal protein S12 methylthiotransferase
MVSTSNPSAEYNISASHVAICGEGAASVPENAPLKVCLVSLGCPKNLVDSEKMLGDLAAGGCTVAAPMDHADVIVVNTCAFLSAAREEALEVIGEAAAYKRKGSARRVVVAGCLPSRDREHLYELLPDIDAIVGVNDRDKLLQAVLSEERYARISPHTGGIAPDGGRFRLTPSHTAYLRIAEGCSNRCAYCTVPAIRGPFRSKPFEEVLSEAGELVADGAIELNIIAQDTTAYGEDLEPTPEPVNLSRLMRALNELDGIQWIRLMYAHPRRLSDELIDALTECEHVVPYVDLPLQHVSDGVLKRMNRRTTRSEVEVLLGKVRQEVPEIAIRTSFIVGFPGETDDHFSELLQFVREFRFEALGAFEFSPEEGTPAATMPDQIPLQIRTQRREQIMLAQQEITFAANARSVGGRTTVLVDGIDTEGRCIARDHRQAPEIDSVCILTHPREAGTFVEGEIVDYDAYDLIVEPQE